ncbi:alpha/beta hydrolase [Nocardioides campestrisoli]|uniref:alpha/beta hydrolase n=1 Tax=Nocardioides campestrisoli TaxID=2736757 RepID=UPI00163D62F2|nr:alpha/beta hydrolase [Nocardioides campestrisoli]
MSRGLALVLPGRGYPPAAPLLHFARQALVQHDFAARAVAWASDPTTPSEDEADSWVRRHVEEAVAQEGGAEPALLVGKSLGTRAASYAAERGVPAIWLTPLLTVPEVADAIAANPARQLVVGGLVDELWDAEVAERLLRGGCDVLEIPDADHSMGTRDAVRSAEIQYAVAEATELFLRSLG